MTNEAQIDYWNREAGETWARYHDRLHRQIEPLGARAMALLAAQPGERILDVGCGCGQTSRALAEAVAPAGEVVGVDVSRPMLAVARDEGAGIAHLSFCEADEATARFEKPFDAAFSRFGVMFFEEPVPAFANIAAALKPGGRIAFVCWQGLHANDWMRIPLMAAMPHLPPLPVPDPHAPGPFAFADKDRLRAILEAAGFTGIGIEPHEQLIGGNGLEETLDLTFRVGPLGAMIRERPELRTSVEGAVRAALAAEADASGAVWMRGAVWLVVARTALAS
ncbi:class I SAM-dependent methyltransferase [Thermaurantiacus sp.]